MRSENKTLLFMIVSILLTICVYLQDKTIDRQNKELEAYRFYEKMNDTLITNVRKPIKLN